MAAAALLCCGCLKDNSYTPPEQHEQEQGGAKEYTISTYDTFSTGVKELSSICFNASSDGFYAVSDEGKVYELGLDGKTRAVLYDKSGHDWEGVEFNGKDILLLEESESALYRLEGGSVSLISKIDIPGGGVSGKGPEGLMCAKDTVFVANQASPTRIVKHRPAGTVYGYVDISFVSKYLSDLCYDPIDNTMWIVDSKGPAFYHCTLDGKLIATYNIPFVKQAEAIAIDHKGGIAWIGCDTTSNLYRMKIEI